MEAGNKKVLVIGVIGADVHAVSNKILYHAFTEAGFEVINSSVLFFREVGDKMVGVSGGF